MERRESSRGYAASRYPLDRRADPIGAPRRMERIEDHVTNTPVVVRSPKRRGLELRELWDARELVQILLLRDIQLRYKQTAFGVGWAVGQPLLMMLVFSVFLSRAAGLHPESVSYPLFALAALVPWTFFSQGLSGAANSMLESESVITKVYFPRLVIPIAAAGSFLLDLAIGTVVLLVAVVLFGPTPTVAIVAVIPLAAMAWLATLSVGIGLSAVNVRYRDVRYALPFLTQLWLFATPVVYSSAAVPENLRPWLALNPMTGVVEGFQWAVLGIGLRPDVPIVISLLATVTLLVLSVVYFRRFESTFADVI